MNEQTMCIRGMNNGGCACKDCSDKMTEMFKKWTMTKQDLIIEIRKLLNAEDIEFYDELNTLLKQAED